MWSISTTLEKEIRDMKQKKKQEWKTCQICRERKLVDEFDKIRSGYKSNCKKCNAIDKKLVRLYKETGHTIEELMAQFNCSEITINNKLKGNCNKSKDREKQKQRNRDSVIKKKTGAKKIIINEKKLRFYYEEKGLTPYQCAKKFNCSSQSIYTRIKKLGISTKCVYERTCKICSKKFTTNYNFQIYCSVKCREYAQSKTNQEYFEHGTFLIFKRDKFKCIYCGNSSIIDGVKLHCDHIKPKYESGTDEAKNLVTSCQECNLAKNNARLEPSTEKQILKEVAKRNKLNDILPNMKIKFQKRLYSIKRKK